MKLPFCLLLALLAAVQAVGNSTAKPIAQIEEPDNETLLSVSKNLARWHMGAVLYHEKEDFLVATNWREASEPNNPATLINDDPTQAYPISTDVHKFILDLGDYQLVKKFGFYNISAQGRFQVFYSDVLQSSLSNRWRPAEAPIDFSTSGSYQIEFAPFDARYLLIVMDVTNSGQISSFAAYGNTSVLETRYAPGSGDTENPTVADVNDTAVSYDYANLHSGARVSHLNSGELQNTHTMIDDNLETGYRFGNKAENILVLDLQNQRDVNRVSMIYDAPPGEMSFYFMNALPENLLSENPEMAMIYNNGSFEPLLLASTNGLGQSIALAQNSNARILYIPEGFFQDYAPNFVHTIEKDESSFRLDFDELTGRYLLIRWQSQDTANPNDNLTVYEINLFGDIPPEDRLLRRIPIFEFLEEAAPPQSVTPGSVSSAAPVQSVGELPFVSP